MTAKKEEFLNLRHVRVPEQKEKMEEIIKDGVCPFCDEYLEKYHTAPIEKRGAHWVVTKNDFPYEGSILHYLVIHREHIVDIRDISPEGWSELGKTMKWLVERYDIPGGALYARFGDSNHTGATVTHLHAHLIVGGSYSEKSEKLKITAGYKKK